MVAAACTGVLTLQLSAGVALALAGLAGGVAGVLTERAS
jgi:hypothetical protein